jgi:hypothetical protein
VRVFAVLGTTWYHPDTMRRGVIEALTAAVTKGDQGVAYQVIERSDWLLRGRSRRLLAQAMTDAAHRAGTAEGERGDETIHLMRVASLDLRGMRDVDFASYDEVLRAYERSSPPPPRRRFPLATVGALAGLLAVVALGGWQLAQDPTPAEVPRPERPAVVRPRLDFKTPLARREMPAPSATAYAAGGVPLSDPRLEEVFATTLPRLVVLIGAAASGRPDKDDERARLDRSLRAPELLAVLGPGAAARWNDLLDTLAEFSRLKLDSPKAVNASMRLHDAAGLFDDELAARGLAYHVDADVWDGKKVAYAAFYLYKVEEVVLVQGGERPTRVLVVRRLDQLNISRSILGMQAEYLRDPLVLRHGLEAHAVTFILPALDTDSPLKLGDATWNDTADGVEVAKAAGAAARAAFNAPLGDDLVRIRVIGALVAEREHAVESWRKQAEGTRTIRPVETALLPAAMFMSLRGVVDETLLRYGGKLDVRLRELDVEGAVARIADLLMPAVARHEAQHGRDEARDVPLAMPAPVMALLGGKEAGVDAEDWLAVAVKYEISAHLSEIAGSGELGRIEMILLSSWAFDRLAWGDDYSYVAVFVIEELANRLGAPAEGPMVHDGEIDRARLSKAFLFLLSRSPSEVQQAAAGLWAELYGEPLVLLR